MACKCKRPKYKVGDRVWVATACQYATIERVHVPPPCDEPKCVNRVPPALQLPEETS